MYRKIASLFLLSFLFLNTFAQKLELLWETDTIFNTPESVFIDDGFMYVSNIGGKDPSAKDGNGFISKLSTDGKLIALKWVEGLNSPKGIFADDKIVVVSDVDKVVVIDKQKASIISTIPIEGAVFLNDIVLSNEGVIIVSDYKAKTIYQIKNQLVSVLINDEQLDHVNGLHLSGTTLYAGTSSKVFTIDITSGVLNFLVDSPVWIDGIEPISENKIIVSDWGGSIVLLEVGKEPNVLLALDKKKYNTADMDFDPLTKTFFIPTFFRNTILAYKIHE